MWTARAIVETEAASARGRRTWFLTVTHRIRHEDEGVFAKEVSDGLKRLRTLGRFRFLLVFERHKKTQGAPKGYPHCHAMIHEIDRLLHSDFVAALARIGFIKAKLLTGDPKLAASYCSKYMSKQVIQDTGDNLAVVHVAANPRVRASIGYGGQGPTVDQQPSNKFADQIDQKQSAVAVATAIERRREVQNEVTSSISPLQEAQTRIPHGPGP